MNHLNVQLAQRLLSEHKDKQGNLSTSITALCEYYLNSQAASWKRYPDDGIIVLESKFGQHLGSVSDTPELGTDLYFAEYSVYGEEFKTKEEAIAWVKGLATKNNFIVER